MKNCANGSKSGCWLIYIASFFVTLLTVLVIILIELGSPSMTDERDDRRYKTVQIGSQTWMAQNLNYKTKNSWCYGNEQRNCQKYGRLYTWDAAMHACPSGWRLPNKEDYETLFRYVGGRPITESEMQTALAEFQKKVQDLKEIPESYKKIINDFLPLLNSTLLNTTGAGLWKNAGRKLQSKRHWDVNEGIDKYGFSVLPAGSYDNEYFSDLGDMSMFWTSTQKNIWFTNVAYAVMFVGGKSDDSSPLNDLDGPITIPSSPSVGASIRCVKY